MNLMGKVDIRPSKLADKDALMKMVNEVYEQCEGHLWIAHHQRLSEERFTSYHSNKQLLIAETRDTSSYHSNKHEQLLIAETRDTSIVGCVVMSECGANGRELSMLVVKPECRGQGIGLQLVDHVISTARSEQCEYVRLELLYPSHQPDPWKQRLRKWYESIGFQFARNEDFKLHFPDAIPDLVQEITFSVFEKPLIE